MRFRLIEDHRDVWPVRVMCDALSVSPSGFYAWRSQPESLRKIANRELLVDIRRVHAQHRGRYGAPRIHAELRAEGQTVCRKRVERVMRQHGIRAHAPCRYRVCTTDSKHSLPVAANLLDRNFTADRPNQVWLADITYVPTGEGWLYLAVILDLFTRKVVGWSMREHMRAELTIAALTMALQRRRPGPGLIHHSDRGSQYAAGDYRKILQAAAITPSMSRKANCWDNAPMESFFGTLKTELVHQREYPDRDTARRDLFAYIEGYYNRQRIHSAMHSSERPLRCGLARVGKAQSRSLPKFSDQRAASSTAGTSSERPASMSRTEAAGISARRRATTEPEEPEPHTMKS